MLDVVKIAPLARTVPLTVSAAALVVLALGGCSAPAADTGHTSAHSSSPSATSGTPSATPSGGPSASAAATTGTGAAPATCAAADLTGAVQDTAGGGAAGSVIVDLVLTNSSSTPCLLHGTPGVSYVGHGNGTQLGAAASRSGMSTAPTITLAPGDSAAAPLRETHAENYSGCTQVPADGLRVYPPGATDALFVPQKTTACSNADIVLLDVKALQQR